MRIAKFAERLAFSPALRPLIRYASVIHAFEPGSDTFRSWQESFGRAETVRITAFDKVHHVAWKMLMGVEEGTVEIIISKGQGARSAQEASRPETRI